MPNPVLNALQRKLVAYRGAGRDDLVTAVEARIAEFESSADEQPEPEPEPDERTDGVHSVGGGWHEVVIGGEVIDKIRGAEAAQEAYDAYQETGDGND